MLSSDLAIAYDQFLSSWPSKYAFACTFPTEHSENKSILSTEGISANGKVVKVFFLNNA